MEAKDEKRLRGYELKQRIGDGGFGEVYLAQQTTVGREVAIKIIHSRYANHPEFIRRFEAEAHLIARLEHPHITPLHDFWRDPQGAYLVMRYLKGGSVYEALVAGMPDYQSLAGQLNELTILPQTDADTEYHWVIVANSALAEITRLLFPTASAEHQMTINVLYDEWLTQYQSEVGVEVLDQSIVYGQDMAHAIFNWATSDGGHEGYLRNFPSDFVPPEHEGFWIPTPRLIGDPQSAMQPYWGNNRPFVLQSGAECIPAAPPNYSEEPDSAFYIEAIEVYEVSQMLTDEQRDIALFWADDPGQTATPPGHSISILTQILRQEAVTLDVAAVAYAKMGMAVADAFIGCWHAKYTYNLVRPVTYIQNLIDADWMPIVNTPPFPEYPSGHSVQTGAAAVVLADLFGNEYIFTDDTHDERGLTSRTFTSFSDMAEEAALSRLYGGIHYRSAIELGLEQGECIGAQVNALQFKAAP